MRAATAAAMLAMTMATPAAAHAPGTKPIPNDPASWVQYEDYPPSAVIASQSGLVAFKIYVDDGGRPVSCVIRKSSGVPALDAKTCEVVLQRAHFEPARDAKGKPSAGTYDGKIHWIVPADGDHGEVIESYRATVTAMLDADGALESCTLTYNQTSQTTPLAGCRGMQEAAVRSGLVAKAAIPNGLILVSESEHAYTGQPLPPSAGQTLTEDMRTVLRFRIDETGHAVACRQEAVVAGSPPMPTPCDTNVHFPPAKSADGHPTTVDATWTDWTGWRRRVGPNDS